ncbi:protein NETWORKED 1A-like [Zingiber officinale]|uniref:NAB domain-containing protein n=1 Tax=Zingiber officinale TaxID=94328 RepID=A0A8J5IRH2_ZINOF|nr:protein NETWORKED 1A-like [Zingiber officinale]KAG6537668.1 hypothetical protein ZIOFF_002763 [Zingiber officinale]
MTTLANSDPVHLYSWWGNHISPKNSKWIQDNVQDMDVKVKAMIKLIEEDADSFARRAEMYYKKRPELKKLVDEFYRGYRALAERYEQSTRLLRHAHRTIAEALPNQIPLLFPDESPNALSANVLDPQSPKIFSPIYTQYDSDDFKKEAFGLFPDFYVKKRNGADYEESDPLSGRKGINQYDEKLPDGEGAARAYSSVGKVKKVLHSLEVEVKAIENKAENHDQEAKMKRGASNVIRKLQQDVSELSSEIHVLKDQIMEESKRANNAENEVQSLKGTLSRLNSERDETHLQQKISLERISSLELHFSHTENELCKLRDDMTKEVNKLKNVEELNLSLQWDLETLELKARMQEKEINQKQEDLNKLQSTLQEKYQNLKALELSNKSLEEDIIKLKEENSSLNEAKVHSALVLKGLQEEIILLKEKEMELEHKIAILVEEKEVLAQELYHVKKEKDDLEQRHQDLMEKMQAVDLCVELLQTAIKELQIGNYELKEARKKHEAEKDLFEEKLKDMDKISEKNAVLYKLLSDVKNELEDLRGKFTTLESTHESLKSEISVYISERDSLAAQVKILSGNLEMLSVKNSLLENSLSDASNEVESLRSKLMGFENSCQSLNDQNSTLHAERHVLISQLESITINLEDLDSRHKEIMDKHLNLLREKDQMINQVKQLEDALRLETEQHETLIHSYKNLLCTSENKISILQEEYHDKEKQLQSEQHDLIGTLVEKFVLERSLYDFKEANLALSFEAQKHIEACRSAEILISEQEQEILIQTKKILSLSNYNERLIHWINLIVKALSIDKEFRSLEDIQDEVLLEIILYQIQKLFDSVSEVESNNIELHLQTSVITTLLRHIGMDVFNLGLQKYSLESELEMKNEKLFSLDNEKREMKGREALLLIDLDASNQREEVLKNAINVLTAQVTDLKKVLQRREYEITNLIQEKKSLSLDFCNLSQKHNALEGEHLEIVVEAMSLDHLYLLSDSLHAERLTELKSLNYDVESLHVIKNRLADEITRLNEKISVLEAEKMFFSGSVLYLEEELRNRLLSLQFDLDIVTSLFEELDVCTETTMNKLMQTEAQLSEANQNLQSIHDKNMVLKELLESLELDNSEIKLAKEEMEGDFSIISQEIVDRNEKIRCLEKENKMMQRNINEMHQRVEVLLCYQEQLISDLKKETSETILCEGEISEMMGDIQTLTINAAVQDEKFHDLIVETKICDLVQREVLISELDFIKENVEDLQNKLHEIEGENQGLKADVGTLLSMLNSLWDSIISMEEQIVSTPKAKLFANQAEQKISFVPQHGHEADQFSENHMSTKAIGVFLLERLIDKVKTLERVIRDGKGKLKQEMIDSSAHLNIARKDDNGYPKGDQMIKDIQLDQAIGSLPSREKLHKEIGYNPSLEINTDELIIDQFDSPKSSMESLQERNMVQKRFHSDLQRLLALKASIDELKKRIISKADKLPAIYGYDSVKEQLEEAEAGMLELTDTNNRLKLMAENCSSLDSGTHKSEGIYKMERMQISEQAKGGSKDVARLELKLQKIQYVLMKLEEEFEYRQDKGLQRNRVSLRDYLYGRRDNESERKRNPFCGLMRPRTKVQH